jgi:CBS domain-containing protein
MRKDETYLHPAASVVEAVFVMMQERKRYISVVDNGLLKGVITAMDIFRKIIS